MLNKNLLLRGIMRRLLALREFKNYNPIQAKAKFPEFQAQIGRIWCPEGSRQLLVKHRRSSGAYL